MPSSYHHDLAYKYLTDKAGRNKGDQMMIEEMDAIKNPTMRERIERGIIKPIISTKEKFGLGCELGSLNPSPSVEKNYQPYKKRTLKKKKEPQRKRNSQMD